MEWVASIPWLYCVLDEGHIIKSPKAKITLAAKRVNATHRCEGGGGRVVREGKRGRGVRSRLRSEPCTGAGWMGS